MATGNIRNDDLLNLVESRLAEIDEAFAQGDHVELRRGAIVSYPRRFLKSAMHRFGHLGQRRPLKVQVLLVHAGMP